MDSTMDHAGSVDGDLPVESRGTEDTGEVISNLLTEIADQVVAISESKGNECVSGEVETVLRPTTETIETTTSNELALPSMEGLDKITEKMETVNSGLEKTPDCGPYLTVSVELSPDTSEGESLENKETSEVGPKENSQPDGLPLSDVTSDCTKKATANSVTENVGVVPMNGSHDTENETEKNSVPGSFGIVRSTKRVSLVAEYRSDGSDSFDSSSDSESSSSSSSIEPEPVLLEKDSDEEKAVKVKPRTKGEILVEDMPPIEDLCITVDERTPLVLLGKVASIVGNLVVIQSEPNTAALDSDSIVFTKERKSLGQVFETFGPVKSPLYSIRFNNLEQLANKGVEVGTMLYCAPSVPDYTHFVFMNDLIRMKGSDASWENNNEPPPKYLDYSDDEQERAAKGKKNRKRGKEAACQQWPPPDDADDSPDESPMRNQQQSRGRGRPLGRGRGRGRPNRPHGEGQPSIRPPQPARFGAPPTFPMRPMGMPPMFAAGPPPRFGGPAYPWPQQQPQPMAPPPNWMWPRGPHPGNRGPPPGVPPPGVSFYASQADYWGQYGK